MEWNGCVHWDKFRCDFVARTFALVRPVLHRVSKGNQTVPNARKQYETHQNVSLGSDGVDRVRSLRKKSDATSWHKVLHEFGTFCTVFCKATKRSRMHPNGMKNAPKRQFRVQWSGSGAFVVKKFRRNFVARTFVLVRPVFHRVL